MHSNETNNMDLQAASAAKVACTLDGIITGWNPAAEALFGYLANEAVGMPVHLLFPAGQTLDCSDAIKKSRQIVIPRGWEAK